MPRPSVRQDAYCVAATAIKPSSRKRPFLGLGSTRTKSEGCASRNRYPLSSADGGSSTQSVHSSRRWATVDCRIFTASRYRLLLWLRMLRRPRPLLNVVRCRLYPPSTIH